MTEIILKVDDEIMSALVDLFYKHIKGRAILADVTQGIGVKGTISKPRFSHSFDKIIIELEPKYKRKIKRRKI